MSILRSACISNYKLTLVPSLGQPRPVGQDVSACRERRIMSVQPLGAYVCRQNVVQRFGLGGVEALAKRRRDGTA
jgi:hypothetical protein